MNENRFKTMKIKDTITLTEKSSLFLQSSVVGLFTDMFQSDDVFYSLAYPMCLGYYTVQSANKTVSPVYQQMYEFSREFTKSQGLTDNTDEEILALVNSKLGSSVIRPKFIDKWNRVYNTLITEQYNALDDYSETETKTANDTDKTTYNITDGKTGTNTDTLTHNVTTEDNGKTATSETTVRAVETANDIYGFNSSVAVGDTATTENNTETVTGEADKNTTQNTQIKTGTESKQIGINETYNKTGTETKEYGVNETRTRTGRHESGADLVEKELNLRNKQIFFDIVYRDIDSVATISIY